MQYVPSVNHQSQSRFLLLASTRISTDTKIKNVGKKTNNHVHFTPDYTMICRFMWQNCVNSVTGNTEVSQRRIFTISTGRNGTRRRQL